MHSLPWTQRAILDAFDATRASTPHLPAIEVAKRLSISEGELQAARLGRDVITLPLTPHALAERFHRLGRVRALTRSRHAVLEQEGSYPVLRGSSQAGLLLDPGGLDLRLHFSQWHWSCLIRDRLADGEGGHQERFSLQIFDRYGRALHKLFSLEPWPLKEWQQLEALGSERMPAFTQLAKPASRPLPSAPGLAADWMAMSDVHQFFALLKRHGLSRREANALMEGRYTRSLTTSALEQTLSQACENAMPLMLFVASPGCVQIRSGRVPPPLRRRGWLNLFGEGFTLHLDDAGIDEVWQVHKPNRDGGVTSLEAFDAEGELILQLYAQRSEGQPERPDWRELLRRLGEREAAA
ncbi:MULTISPECIES: ChuX/HutX family heme-like substrate-binding protein [Halomonadaceae]|uniref:ChuX/HutX family heme-like substrate-binding protein n=1 Tax=Halomonadaceae TaxID=28256 RepID=UPI0015999838|nr:MULTISPECIES: ChuX/HutX family heme-like substrate-binding protein [Halomonas]QJQ95238.1 heme degradation protein [Halomonas sp. PA5]